MSTRRDTEVTRPTPDGVLEELMRLRATQGRVTNGSFATCENLMALSGADLPFECQFWFKELPERFGHLWSDQLKACYYSIMAPGNNVTQRLTAAEPFVGKDERTIRRYSDRDRSMPAFARWLIEQSYISNHPRHHLTVLFYKECVYVELRSIYAKRFAAPKDVVVRFVATVPTPLHLTKPWLPELISAPDEWSDETIQGIDVRIRRKLCWFVWPSRKHGTTVEFNFANEHKFPEFLFTINNSVQDQWLIDCRAFRDLASIQFIPTEMHDLDAGEA